MRRLFGLLDKIIESDEAVLVEGENGTGKEMIARAIHYNSARQKGPFVAENVAAIPETLVESELFGHMRGAFTGADRDKPGLFEVAEGGTLFLDEVGDIPPALQVKLLRLLDTGTYRRVGSPELRRSDFRLVCATHRDLEGMVEAGAFRADLFYRIAVFPIELPPLRERREDIALLAESMLRRIDPRRDRHLGDEALARLEAYDFPGNARELLNLLERASILADGETLLPDHLPHRIGGGGGSPRENELVSLAEAQRRYLRWCLAVHHGSRRDLAARLGLSERALYRRLREIGQPSD